MEHTNVIRQGPLLRTLGDVLLLFLKINLTIFTLEVSKIQKWVNFKLADFSFSVKTETLTISHGK